MEKRMREKETRSMTALRVVMRTPTDMVVKVLTSFAMRSSALSISCRDSRT
jgi:hypothetical protein